MLDHDGYNILFENWASLRLYKHHTSYEILCFPWPLTMNMRNLRPTYIKLGFNTSQISKVFVSNRLWNWFGISKNYSRWEKSKSGTMCPLDSKYICWNSFTKHENDIFLSGWSALSWNPIFVSRCTIQWFSYTQDTRLALSKVVVEIFVGSGITKNISSVFRSNGKVLWFSKVRKADANEF